MTVLEMKNRVASFGGNPSSSTTRYTPADYVINGNDLVLMAMNDAVRSFQKAWDFNYCQTDANLTITQGGSSIITATAVPSGDITIKRVSGVLLPIAGGNFIPIEFVTNDNYLARVRSQLARQTYSATATLDDLGISDANPIAIQQGFNISLMPEEQFTFPVAARLSVVRFMPEYVANSDHDFFLDIGTEAVFWASVVALNRLTKNFSVRPSEGDVAEPMDLAQMAFEGLVQWDISLNTGTSTPEMEIPKLPQLPQPKPTAPPGQ